MLHRLVFFTDAVFAIVLTLLVLELRPPEVRDAKGPTHTFMQMGPHFLVFFMSFGLIPFASAWLGAGLGDPFI